MAGGQERTVPIKKGPAEPAATRIERPDPVPIRQPALPPEPSPSARTIEARKQMTKEEVDALNEFVTRLTESAATSGSVREQRRLLFAIGNELKRLKPDSQQAAEVLDRMRGFQIELGGQSYIIERYLTRGAFGAAFVVKDRATEEEGVLKLSLPFDRREMFLQPGASSRDVMKAEQIRNSIMEAAAMSRLSQYDVPPGKPRQPLERKGAFPPFPLLKAAQFIPHPDDPDKKNPSLRIQALVMELLQGNRLDQLIQQADLARDPEILKRFIRELLQAVQYMHYRGIYHSDLKLSNVMADLDMHPYLIDFGSARVGVIEARQRIKKDPKIVYGLADNIIFAGTDYISGFEDPSAPRDMYALGVMIRKIIQGTHQRRQTDHPEERMRSLPQVSQHINALSELMTKVEPKERPTITQLLKQLDSIG